MTSTFTTKPCPQIILYRKEYEGGLQGQWVLSLNNFKLFFDIIGANMILRFDGPTSLAASCRSVIAEQ
ncbi:rCG38456 [Rattus norvegicus]|uniref:RCG38456 n=1 Tax=Rattus norvegicus TaxID=10116 RepID=A6KM50_RAT|nr:rCG38456 [Rattus norvegicus]